jgi:hypothetical protein
MKYFIDCEDEEINFLAHFEVVFNIVTNPAIVMQQEDKQTFISVHRLRYCWTIKMETVFSVWFMPKYYKQGQSSSGVGDFSSSVL